MIRFLSRAVTGRTSLPRRQSRWTAGQPRWTVEILNRQERRWEPHEESHDNVALAQAHAYRIIDSGNPWVRIWDEQLGKMAYRTRRVQPLQDNDPFPVKIGGRTVMVRVFQPQPIASRVALVRA